MLLTCSQSLVVTSVERPCSFGNDGRLKVTSVLLHNRFTRPVDDSEDVSSIFQTCAHVNIDATPTNA